MPDETGGYIQSKMKACQFEDTSEYFRRLVHRNKEMENSKRNNKVRKAPFANPKTVKGI